MKKRSKRDLGFFTPEMREFIDPDYLDQLSDEEFEICRKFYKEFYDRSFEGKPLHKNVDSATKEVNRRQYVAKNDVFNLSKRRGGLEYMNERPVTDFEPVSHAPDELEEVFKLKGPQGALEYITTRCLNEIDEGVISEEIALERYFLNRERLRKLEAHDKRTSRELRKRRYNGR